MFKLKITDGKLKKIEKRLLKVLKEQYDPDGLYCCIDTATINDIDGTGYSLEYTIRYGRCGVDGKKDFNNQVVLWVNSNNLQFISGQFYQLIIDNE